MKLRPLRAADAEAAGALLCEAYGRAAETRGFPPPWGSAREAAQLAAGYAETDGDGALAAEDDDGALRGVGFVRRRGDVATIGPMASSPAGAGTGGALLDGLIARAEAWGCGSVRLCQGAWNPNSFALYAGRSFAVVDVVAHLARPAGAPRIEAARGLEITPMARKDLAEVTGLDLRLTGLERSADLEAAVKLVARRRGALVGFLGARGGLLGPALALDVSDLFALVARGLAEVKEQATARLSTAAPTAMLAALALGFRVIEVGTVMSRGVSPAARPPQLYSLLPEIL